MNRVAANPCLGEVAGNLVGTMFSARENQYLAPLLTSHQVLQQICLTRFVDRVNSLINKAHRGISWRDLNFLWLMQELTCQRLDLARERGGKHQRLALFGQLRVDAAHRGDKAHIEHPVGLIQHPHPHVVEPHRTLPEQIQQATWGGYQNIGAPREMADLRSDVDAATHHLAMQFESRAVATDAISDLRRELPRGGQNQTTDVFRPRARTPLEHMKHGQGKSSRFARSGLRGRHQVAT